MIGAGDPQASIITATLNQCCASVESSGHTRWTFPLSDGTDVQTTACMDGGWLLLDAPFFQSPTTNHESRLWQLLQWNATLPGGAKFAAPPAGPAVHVRAEVLLEDEVDLPRRIGEACAGFKVAAAKAARVDVIRSPLPPREPVLSPVEGGHDERVQWMAAKDDGAPNAEFVECSPATDLAAQCRESGWAFAERSGKLIVNLEVPDAFQQAVVEAKTQRRVAVLVDVITSGEPLAMPCQEALALLLLRTCAVVRMARAVVEERAAGVAARFEVLFSDTPCSAELAHAFSALSVACRISSREAAVLQHDETVAREYLTSVSRGSWIVSRTTDHGK